MIAILNTLYFSYHVFKRMVSIGPRKNKSIKMLYIEYINSINTATQFGIKYRFRNAVCYAVNDKRTISTTSIIPKEGDEKEVRLTVYGFFRKNSYTLLLKPGTIQVTKISQI